MGAGAFSTFGGLLPLVASLLAIPQKDLLQGLANLKSFHITQYFSSLGIYHLSEAHPLRSRFNDWAMKYTHIGRGSCAQIFKLLIKEFVKQGALCKLGHMGKDLGSLKGSI